MAGHLLQILKEAGFRYGAIKIHLGQSEVPVQR